MINARKLASRLYVRAKNLVSIQSRYCPVCGIRSNLKFLPLPSYYKEKLEKYKSNIYLENLETLNQAEYICSFCESTDRDRLIALFIMNYINEDSSCNLLDIAPATSLKSFLKKQSNINYRSADLNMDGVDDKIDLMDMYIYPDNSFDIIICSHVLEHVPDDKKAMKELYRILKPKGWGILMVPISLKLTSIDEDTQTSSSERWRRFGQDDHVRLYSKKGFIERLEFSGLKVKQFGIESFGRNIFKKCGINPKSVLYIVNK